MKQRMDEVPVDEVLIYLGSNAGRANESELSLSLGVHEDEHVPPHSKSTTRNNQHMQPTPVYRAIENDESLGIESENEDNGSIHPPLLPDDLFVKDEVFGQVDTMVSPIAQCRGSTPDSLYISLVDESNGQLLREWENRSFETARSNCSVTQSSSNNSSGASNHDQNSPPFEEGFVKRNKSVLDAIAIAKQSIDASSMAFMEHLRAAAHRRKQAVTRSQESFADKTREPKNKATIASPESKTVPASPKIRKPEVLQKTPTLSDKTNHRDASSSVKKFRARPMPKHSGAGQIGIPKVEKRPSTNPVSPLLGNRRKPQSVTAQKDPSRFRGDKTSFKARPIPSEIFSNSGGQTGIPKVTKKTPTIPVSPCLGKKRSTRRLGSKKTSQNVPKSPLHLHVSTSSSTQDNLVGLNIIADTSAVDHLQHFETPKAKEVPLAFVPHSTQRARRRAAFDKDRQRQEKLRREKVKEDTQQVIEQKRQEMARLKRLLR